MKMANSVLLLLELFDDSEVRNEIPGNLLSIRSSTRNFRNGMNGEMESAPRNTVNAFISYRFFLDRHLHFPSKRTEDVWRGDQ